MANGVGDADTRRPRLDRDAIELLDLFRLRPRGVLGHVHDRNALADGETDRLRRLLDDPVDVPLFGELADRRRPDEEVRLDGDPDAVRDLDDRLDEIGRAAWRGRGEVS